MPTATPTPEPTLADMIREILGLPDGTGVSAFQTAAESLISRLACMGGYDDATQQTITAWVAAHFYETARPDSSVVEEKMGDAYARYASYNVKPGKGLESSSFGRTALSLDTLGCLRSVGKRPVVLEAMGPNVPHTEG